MRSGTRSKARSGTRSKARSGNKTRSKARSGNMMRGGMFTRSKAANRRLMTSTIESRNRNRPVIRRRRRSRSRNENVTPIRFNPIRELTGAEAEEYNSDKTEPYSNENSGFDVNMVPTGVSMPSASLRRTFSVPLTRALSVGQKYELSTVTGTDLVLNEPLQRFVSASPELDAAVAAAEAANSQVGSDDSQGSLIRYLSLAENGQSLLRFVLYTSDVGIAQRFIDVDSIQLLYNSHQNVPLDVVFIRHPTIRHDQIDGIRMRLPESVQHLSQTFTEGQIDNALTKDNCFLLTIELDNERNQRPAQLTPDPTGPIFGVLCCSEETATVDSSRFVDDQGAPLITFDSHANDPYIYVHLFTYLTDRTVGQNFFTGSLMLEGLYNLFNPRVGRIIYLEAITVQATLNFYDRFGMERLKEMTLSSPIIIHGIPTWLVYFDPFKGFIVPDEIPYVLTNHGQIQRAAIAAREQRRTKQVATEQGVMAEAQVRPLGRPLTDDERGQLENALDVFRRDRARTNRHGMFPLIRPPAP